MSPKRYLLDSQKVLSSIKNQNMSSFKLNKTNFHFNPNILNTKSRNNDGV